MNSMENLFEKLDTNKLINELCVNLTFCFMREDL
jgi:hypothetical protein